MRLLWGNQNAAADIALPCEVPWEPAEPEVADAMLRVVDRLVAVIESNRDIGDAKRGRVGEVTYALRQSPAGKHAFVATIPVEFTSEKDDT